MMPCPICDADTQVYDSRPEGELVHRRRKCRNGHRFNTKESQVGRVWNQDRQVVPPNEDKYDDTELFEELTKEMGVGIEG